MPEKKTVKKTKLFDLLHAQPNYALLFYRQWVVSDPDLRKVEWDKLIPVFRQWSGEIEAQLDEARLGGMNLFLFFSEPGLEAKPDPKDKVTAG